MFSIQIITDGKIGDLVQCRGVADRLTALIEADCVATEAVVAPDRPWSLPIPYMPVQPKERHLVEAALKADLVLASGRRTVPYLHAIRRRRDGTRPLIVFLKDPRLGLSAADFVWAPVHDELLGANVIATHTSPHGLTPAIMEAAKQSAILRFSSHISPVTGVVLGGDSGSVRWDTASADAFALQLQDALSQQAGSVLVTPSRRTPTVLREATRRAVASLDSWIWDGAGTNPYAEILVHSDRIVVTGDSHNMVSEALSTESPVFIHRPPGLQKKLHRFLDAMENDGAIRNLIDGIDSFQATRIDATEEIAAAIAARL